MNKSITITKKDDNNITYKGEFHKLDLIEIFDYTEKFEVTMPRHRDRVYFKGSEKPVVSISSKHLLLDSPDMFTYILIDDIDKISQCISEKGVSFNITHKGEETSAVILLYTEKEGEERVKID